MRKYLHIDLTNRSWQAVDLHGEEVVRSGRYLIAKMLLESGAASVDPLSPQNPLIFSAGPLAGTTLSNGNRISVGCKSPLTGGVKEANSGGTFAYALGQLLIAGLTLHGSSDDWVVIRIGKDGSLTFASAEAYLGKGNYEAAEMLRRAYGEKVSIALCGPVGEYTGLLAGVAFTDREGRPGRLAARGGVGAVMGSKKVKAIVVEFDKMPGLHDRNDFFAASREYANKLNEQPIVKNFRLYGTAYMADFLNYMGGLVVRNFSVGRLVDRSVEPLALGGEYIRERILERHGDPAHVCMPGCVIQCSNTYVDESGKEMVSPLEYETLSLMGSNCGLTNPDDVARMNWIANDLGVDSIETGATLGILMDAGHASFGHIEFMLEALEDIRRGTERGRLLAQGAARVGEHYGIRRVPVIKNQALAAYDPRVVEVTAVSMMTTAMGADHTAGPLPAFDCNGKSIEELAAASFNVQRSAAVIDSLGLCFFSRSVTDTNYELVARAINDCHGTQIDAQFLQQMGIDTLRMERRFNREAGFTPNDDTLPAFFFEEPLPPTNRSRPSHRRGGQPIHQQIG